MDNEERLTPEERQIKERMEEKRVDLTDKIETLETTLMDTVQNTLHSASDVVENVTESVQETVETVKETFNLKRHTERHPWLMLAGAVAAGFAGGRLLPRRRRPAGRLPRRDDYPELESIAERSARPAGPLRQPEPEKPSWFSQLGSTFGDELSKLKGLALGATFGVLRDMLTSAAPEQLKPQLAEVVNSVTTKLGGRPIQGPLFESGENGESHDGHHEPAESSHHAGAHA